MANKLSYIDLFAGCGGLSLGLYNSKKWKGVFAIEKSPDAFKTLEYNLLKKKRHFNWPNWLPKTNHDINFILSNYKSKLKLLRGSIDLVAGGPPCQGFSTAGKRNEDDKRNNLINSYIDFIRLIQPKIIFFENVKGFTQQFDKNKVKGRIYSEYVKTALGKHSKTKDFIGYDTYGELVDFSEYGIPQKRTRFILIGIRKDLTNSVNPNMFFNLIKKDKEKFLIKKDIGVSNTLEDAISDLIKSDVVDSPDTKSFKAGIYSKPKSNYQRLLRADYKSDIPDSHRFVNHSSKTIMKFNYLLKYAEKNKNLSKKIKQKFGIKKHTIIPLSGNLPAPTITTLPDDYIHYLQPRIFTVREYARIQSFNDWFEFKGKYTTGGKNRIKEVPRYSQIGNAIPPLFGEQAGLIINQLIFKING